MILNSRNFVFVSGEKIIRGLFFFIATALIARYLGPEDYGRFSVLIAFVTFVSLISAAGIRNNVMNGLCVEKNNTPKILVTSLLTQFSLFILLFLTLIIALFFLEVGIEYVSLYLLFSLYVLFKCSETPIIFLEAREMFSTIALIQFFGSAVFLTSLIAFIYLDLGLYGIIGSYVIDVSIVFIIASFILVRNIDFSLNRIDFESIRKLLVDSSPYLISSITVFLYQRFDLLLLSYFYNDIDVGIYSAAYRLIEVYIIVPAVLAKVLLPKLIKLKDVKEYDLEFQQRKLYKIVTMFSYLFLFLILILDEKIITIIYGDEFNKFPYLISILAPIAIFVSWGTVAATINIVNSERKSHMLRNITGFTANAFFGLLLIPYYGIYGAAISSIIGFFFLSFGYSFLSKNGDWRLMLNSLILKN